MSVYERRILPHIINLAMNTTALRAERTRCLQDVRGAVLEIGFGTGLNLPHYPAAVTRVVGVDPSETSARLARSFTSRTQVGLMTGMVAGADAAGAIRSERRATKNALSTRDGRCQGSQPFSRGG